MKSLVGSLLRAAGRPNPDASPVPYSAPGRYSPLAFTANSDNEAYLRTYGTAGTIFQIVSLLSTSVAAAEWHLYRKPAGAPRTRYTTGDQGSDQRTEVTTHQALTVWDNPNPYSTTYEFNEAAQQQQELTGDEFWVVGYTGSVPSSIWLVGAHRMEVVPSVDEFIAGYVYTAPSGEKIPLGVDEVIHTKLPNPLDAYRGIGPVQSVLVDIDAMKYSAEWNRNFFVNSATVGGVIQVEQTLTDPQFRQLTDRWREAHQGVSRAHRVAILENGATFTPNTMSIKDMDFSNLRNVSRDVLREAWGIHKSMLGNSDDVNRANAQTAEEVFGRWKVIPRLERRKLTLNHRFLPLFGATGQGVEFDYVNPLPDDREADNAELTAKATAVQLLGSLGIFEEEDILEVVGLPNMRVKPRPAPPPLALPEMTPAGDSDGEPAEDDNQDVQNRAWRESIRMLAPRAAAAPQPDLTAVDAQWRTATAQLTTQYQQQVQPAQRQQLADQIRDAVAAGTLLLLLSLTLDSGAGAALILAAMESYASTAAHQAAAEHEAKGLGSPQPRPAPTSALEPIATAAADGLDTEMELAAGRQAMLLAQAGQPAEMVAQGTVTFLESLSPASVQRQLGGCLSAAQNKSRIGTFAGATARTELIATEVLDRNTCPPCAEIDGHSFGWTDDPAAVAAAQAAYPLGGYIACEGGAACRGTLVAMPDQTATAAFWTGSIPASHNQRVTTTLLAGLDGILGHANGTRAGV